MIEETLKQIVLEVLKTVHNGDYEKDWSSTQRGPGGVNERNGSLRHFIECRLNFEAFKYSRLNYFAERFSGFLFEVTAIYDLDDKRTKPRFSKVQVEIPRSATYYVGDDFFTDIEELEDLIGGTTFKFNYSQKKTKIEIL